MVSSTSALLRLYRSNTAPPVEPPSRERGTLRSTAPIEVMSRRRYVPLRLSTRWACRSHFLAPTRARISSSRTTSKATRIAPWQRVRRSVWKFSCVGSSSSATSFIGSSLDSPPSEACGCWSPRSFHFLFSLREFPIHTFLGTQPRFAWSSMWLFPVPASLWLPKTPSARFAARRGRLGWTRRGGGVDVQHSQPGPPGMRPREQWAVAPALLLHHGASSGGALVSMMQPADLGKLDHTAEFRSLCRPGFRRVAHQ